ncbi:hypothetical protein [Mesorhizobium sp. M6A.T.Cr.TU.016.01.1.1]|uniref:hypothetical protein n=1 Tax=Mesorhizobium sp. M6A.T.Cr.TU.016.01.1.1 TaxID=2493677 RepID=UPI0013E01FD7|nr:hypothetical protein [Mesorhizobium sp. M6A.T.Cr.TU.016.01.1.1]
MKLIVSTGTNATSAASPTERSAPDCAAGATANKASSRVTGHLKAAQPVSSAMATLVPATMANRLTTTFLMANGTHMVGVSGYQYNYSDFMQP